MMTRINVTPIIDVALVLVIILLITAPMLSAANLEVELPAAHSRDIEDQGFISITLSSSGEIAVDELVRADAGLPHALVRQVMEEARLGGATRLGIATRQKGGGGS
jgi:biopolymer transport protein TolR